MKKIIYLLAVVVLVGVNSIVKVASVSATDYDFVDDCHIDGKDLGIFADKWPSDCTVVDCNGTDLNDSNDVDFADFGLFAQHWSKGPDYDCIWTFVQQQWTNTMYDLINDPCYVTKKYPRGTDYYGDYVLPGKWIPKGIGSAGWTHWAGGFVPGSLWYLYQKTGNQQWKDLARDWTAGLANEPNRVKDHESGFTVYRSFGLGYHLTGDPNYKPEIIKAAGNLMTRYDPNVGCITNRPRPIIG